MFETKFGEVIRKVPIIFPNHLIHLDVAKALTKVIGSSRIVGAGEVHVKVDKAHGESTTIGIKAKKNDDQIINTIDYATGNPEMAEQTEKILKDLVK